MNETYKSKKRKKCRGSFQKILKKILLLTLPSLLLCGIVLEIVFRTVIPADNPPRSYFDEAEHLLIYSNTPPHGQKSIGRFGQIRAQWRINNMGWNYPVDYVPRPENKLIAVIGDSYVEALQVDVEKNFSYRLGEMLQPEYEVYAFGVSGAPLSHYLHVSRYVAKTFDPDVMVFTIIHNDFDESLRALYPEFYFYLQLAVEKDGTVRELPPKPIVGRAQYRPWWQKLLFKSALFRYLHFNLKLTHTVRAVAAQAPPGRLKNHDMLREKSDVIKATRYVVETIRRENPDRRILFVMDAPRPMMYSDPMPENTKTKMNAKMKEICADNDVEFLDLTERMREDYRVNKKNFEFEIDGHWNAYGHQQVAEFLRDYLRKEKETTSG